MLRKYAGEWPETGSFTIELFQLFVLFPAALDHFTGFFGSVATNATTKTSQSQPSLEASDEA